MEYADRRDVALVGSTGLLRQAPLEAAETHERLDFSVNQILLREPAGPCGGVCQESPAYRPLTVTARASVKDRDVALPPRRVATFVSPR